MNNNSCVCNVENSYCYDVYGCFSNELTLKAGLLAGNMFDVYIEDRFGNLFKKSGLISDANGSLVIPFDVLTDGLIISKVSENLLLYVTPFDELIPLKLNLGTDSETYDSVLLKFHGGNAAINIIT